MQNYGLILKRIERRVPTPRGKTILNKRRRVYTILMRRLEKRSRWHSRHYSPWRHRRLDWIAVGQRCHMIDVRTYRF